MIDPTLNQISSIQPTDTTSDIAGAAAVTPAYIPSEVESVAPASEAVGIDSINVSTGVSTSAVTTGTATIEKEESPNYIRSEADMAIVRQEILDAYSMNTLEKVLTANRYLSPEQAGVQDLLGQLKAEGVIDNSMTETQLVKAINTYVNSHFKYIAETSADKWYSAATTIKNGGGDCEDLANLAANLMIAALLDRGLSIDEANRRISAVVVLDTATLQGHVYIRYTAGNGEELFVNPTDGKAYGSISDRFVTLFTYNESGVDVVARGFDFSKLATASDIHLDVYNSELVTQVIKSVTDMEGRVAELRREVARAAAVAELVNAQSQYDYMVDVFNDTYARELQHFVLNDFEWGINDIDTFKQVRGFDPYAIPWTIEEYFGPPWGWITWTGTSEGVFLVDEYTITVANPGTEHESVYMDQTWWNMWTTNEALGEYDPLDWTHSLLYRVMTGEISSFTASAYFNCMRDHLVMVKAAESLERSRESFHTFFPGARTDLDSLLGMNPYGQTIEKQGDWYRVNWDSPVFVSWKNEVSMIKGNLMMISLIYEAKRDLRELVQKELTGEEGYKGMQVNRLFTKKVNKLDESYQQLVANVLQACNYMNRNVADEQIDRINNTYDNWISGIWEEEPGSSEYDERTGQEALYNSERYDDINEVNAEQQAIAEANAAAAGEIFQGLAGTVGSVGGTDDQFSGGLMGLNGGTSGVPGTGAHNELIDTFNNLSSVIQVASWSIENALNGASSGLVRQTTSDADDDEYLEMNRPAVISLRDMLNGAINQRRFALMGKQALSDMRNLVHQEMTGIGGRQSRTDLAAELNEKEGREVLQWFDSTVNYIEECVNLSNQIRYNELMSDMYYDIYRAEHDAADEYNSSEHTLLRYASIAVSVISVIYGGVFGLIAMAAGIGLSAWDASIQEDLADELLDIEDKYADRVIDPSDDAYTSPIDDVTIDTGDALLDGAGVVEGDLVKTLEDMTAGDYLHLLNNAHDDVAGSTFFDTIAFARANQDIAYKNLVLLFTQAAREMKTEMRNLVHQEMTSIGGRSSSNMTTYAMESARAQYAFISDSRYASLVDRNYANQQRYEQQMRKHQLSEAEKAADSAYNWSYVPIVGGIVSTARPQLMNLNSQQDAQQAIANGTFATDETLDTTRQYRWVNGRLVEVSSTDYNTLIRNGNLNVDGTQVTDFASIANARSGLISSFIGASIESSIKKTMNQLRSIAHMEMTGISSSTGTDAADKANAINFETAMKTLDYVTDYLVEKAQLDNAVERAKDNVEKLKDQKTSTWTGIITGAVVACIVAYLAPSGLASVSAAVGILNTLQAMAGMLQLAASVMSFVMGLSNTANAWIDYQFAKNQAKGDMDKLMSYLRTQELKSNNIDSTQNRLEALEQECLDEISERLLQDIGGGRISVNRGLASKYKAFIDQLYKRERTKAEVNEVMQELRNIAHEAMTGMGGVQVDALSGMLGIKEQGIKAQIDTYFKRLDAVVQRWNELSDAKKQVEIAELKAISASISTAINTVIFILKMKSTFSKEAYNKLDAQKEFKLANQSAPNAQQPTGTQESAAAAPKSVKQATENLNKASSEYNTMVNNRAFYTDILLPTLDIAHKFAVAHLMKSVIQEQQANANARAGQQGITSSDKSSAVMDANTDVGGEWDMYAAQQSQESGQRAVRSDATQAEIADRSLMNQVVDMKYGAKKEVVESLKANVESLTKLGMGIYNKLTETNVEPYLQKGAVDRIMTLFGLEPSAELRAKLTELASINDPLALVEKAKEIAGANSPVIKLIDQAMANFSANATPQASRANLVAALDSLIKANEAELAKIENATPDQKARLEALRVQLQAKIKQLKEAQEALKNLKLNDVAENRATYESALKEMKKRFAGEQARLTEAQEKLEKLIGKSGASSAIETAKAALKDQLMKVTAEYDIALANYSLSEGAVKAMEQRITLEKANVESIKGQIGAIKGEIAMVQKSVNEEQRRIRTMDRDELHKAVNGTPT